MNIIKKNWLSVVAAIVLFWALASHPYSYFQLLRWVVTIAALFNVYFASKQNQNGWLWVFIGVAVLFNPIAPFYLAKDTWQILDVIGGVIFLSWVYRKV